MKIDQRDDSPVLIDKITFAGSSSESRRKARQALLKRTYRTNIAPRMNCPTYRRQGLPITANLIERLDALGHAIRIGRHGSCGHAKGRESSIGPEMF